MSMMRHIIRRLTISRDAARDCIPGRIALWAEQFTAGDMAAANDTIVRTHHLQMIAFGNPMERVAARALRAFHVPRLVIENQAAPKDL